MSPPTRVDPLRQDKPNTPQPPADATPVWDGLLEQGDVLYLPRGWWHMARPVDAESLHLTIGLTMPTGAAVLRWFLERLKEDERVRRPVPLVETSNGHAEFAEGLRQAWVDAWSPSVVDAFIEWYRSRSVSRPHVSLPPRKPGADAGARRYRLAVGREIRSIGETDVVTVRAGSVELNLRKEVSDALDVSITLRCVPGRPSPDGVAIPSCGASSVFERPDTLGRALAGITSASDPRQRESAHRVSLPCAAMVALCLP